MTINNKPFILQGEWGQGGIVYNLSDEDKKRIENGENPTLTLPPYYGAQNNGERFNHRPRI